MPFSGHVTGYVRFQDERLHRDIIERSVRDYLNFDLDEIRRTKPHFFSEPQHCARAILLYRYFRDQSEDFNDRGWARISDYELPKRSADRFGNDYELWIDRNA